MTTDSPRPFGTGGRCGDTLAADVAGRLADIRRLGPRAALEHWVATGRQGSAVLEVMHDADWAALERAWVRAEAVGPLP